MPTTMNHIQPTTRRGSVLIFALAILAVLALLGVTYVTRANLDRVSAEAAETRTSLARQPEVVVKHIQGLLTADLFGGKLVTESTSRNVGTDRIESTSGSSVGGGIRPVDIWPRMFEDGEHWDYPSVNNVTYEDEDGTDGSVYTFERTELDLDSDMRDHAKLRYDDQIGMFETAPPDDAWLASTEPVRYSGLDEPIGSYNGRWDTWPQITNARSAYRWVADADGQGRGAWVRGDGRFADLARFFLTDDADDRGRGDAGADLLDRENDSLPFYEPDDASALLMVPDAEYNSALLGVEQRGIYGVQMNQVEDWYESAAFNPNSVQSPYEPVDERFWADTDGDGRPDARWTVLDELDGNSGLRWVVAMRIADSSAMVNVNASLESIPRVAGTPHETFGDGTTPMDIELLKLFDESSVLTSRSSARSSGSGDLRHPDISAIGAIEIRDGFRQHMLNGLGLNERFVEQNIATDYFNGINNIGMQRFIGWEGTDNTFVPRLNVPAPTTRAQREAYWRLYAALPDQPLVRGGARYDLGEEIDLRASFGANFRGVKSLEGRFDGVASIERLPGSVMYPDNNSVGPMRSAEHTDAVSTQSLTGVNRPGLSGGNYTQEDRIERIQKDVRRSLTVVNGSSARSVVPAIGERQVPSGRLKPLVNAGSFAGERFQPSLDVQDAFEAFTWALAPLATNKPLMGSLMSDAGGTWADRYNLSYSKSPDFHYGGGDNGPARQWAADVEVPSADDLGPSYALYRAASLAVNLRDAVDDEEFDPTPTVARLFTSPNSRFDPALIPGVEMLTTRFAHGDIYDPSVDAEDIPPDDGRNIIPTQIARPQDGITFVGLDRQPFISQAFVGCLYKNTGGLVTGNLPDPIDLTAGTTVGRTIISIELINPWPDAINLTGYTLMLTDSQHSVEIILSDVTVPAQDRHVVVWTDIAEEDAEFEDNVSDEPGTGGLRFYPADYLSSATLIEPDMTFISPFENPDDPFEEWDRSGASNTAVLLYRDMPGGNGQLLLDRMSKPMGEEFPYTRHNMQLATATVFAPDNAAAEYGANYVYGSSLVRSSGFAGRDGFPLEVIERREDNRVETAIPTSDMGAEGYHGDTTKSLIDLLVDIWADAHTLGDASGHDDFTYNSPFQLFIPDGKLIALSELGMISAFAHTYRHVNGPAPNDPVVTVSDGLATGSRWTTVSEELGKDYHLFYNAMASGDSAFDSTEANPYLGVLDPTRFILGNNADLNSGAPTNLALLPDAMTVPLASRVFDAFEVLGDTLRVDGSPRIEGRINLNTAPKRVLATLPMVLPVDYSLGIGMPIALSQDPNPGMMISAAYERLNAIVQYRDRLEARWSELDEVLNWEEWDPLTPSKLIGLNRTAEPRSRVRYNDIGTTVSGLPSADEHRIDRGFVSMGELAMLGDWDQNAMNAPTHDDSMPHGFLEFAADGQNNLVDGNSTGAARQRDAIDVRPGQEFENEVLEPFDDVEEQLALFRAVSNVTSTRSDVYHAYYVVRAYSPAAIESVSVPSGIDEETKVMLLNDLEPAFEQRGMVVLDRSNVRQPTDRPRVLLRTTLDTTTASN